MNTGALTRGTQKAVSDGSVGCGWTLKSGEKPKSGSTVPTCEPGGQRPNENSTISQIAVACGLPMKPVGKCCSMNLGSSQLHGLLGPPKTPSWIALFSHFILIVTSGCPPACVSLGVTSKSSIPSHAWAG